MLFTGYGMSRLDALHFRERGRFRHRPRSLPSFGAEHLRALTDAAATIAALAFLVGFGALATAASTGPRRDVDAQAQRIAEVSQGDFSDIGLSRVSATMDHGMLAIARRYDPGLLQSQQPGLWVDSAGGSYSAPPEFKLRDLSPQQAILFNASMPFSILPNPAAKPFVLKVADETEAAHALHCLTAAIYYEAATQSDDGQAAVAQVVLNRLRHPLFPKSICGVVFQGALLPTGCQFTFTCDGSLDRTPRADLWVHCQQIAARALHGYVFAPVGEATHYHAAYVVPYWSPTLVKLVQVGAHIFYRWSGSGGLPGAFSAAYRGGEGDAWNLAQAKLIKTSGPVVIVPEIPMQAQGAVSADLQTSEAVAASVSPMALSAATLDLPAPPLAAAAAARQTATLHDSRAIRRLPTPSNW